MCLIASRVVLTHFCTQSSKMGTVTTGFDARLANRPFLVRALAFNPVNTELKWVNAECCYPAQLFSFCLLHDSV